MLNFSLGFIGGHCDLTREKIETGIAVFIHLLQTVLYCAMSERTIAFSIQQL